jgi:hypothetical protein
MGFICRARPAGDMSKPLQWYDHKADNPPWIKALAEVRQLAPRASGPTRIANGKRR